MEKGNEDALKLQDEVAKRYDVKPGTVRKFYNRKFGVVDMNNISLAGSKPFVEAGYLIKKEESKAPKKAKEEKEEETNSLKADNK